MSCFWFAFHCYPYVIFDLMFSSLCAGCPRFVVWPNVPPRDGSLGSPHWVPEFPNHLSQKHNLFICDFIGVVKVCKGQLYSMYNCHSHAFTSDKFFVLKSIIESTHNHVHTRWVLNDLENPITFDLNSNVEHPAFVFNEAHNGMRRST